jgi:TetR/AcrR family transcriptional repressor of nem operon
MARPRKFVEEDVVAAARDQFWSAGYAGTSLDDLTEATGLGRGSLYGAFGDKHTLYLRALEDYCDVTMGLVANDLGAPGVAAFDRLVGHIRNMASPTAAQARRGCLMAKSAAELGSTDKEVTRRVRASMQRYQTLLTDTLAEAQRDGDIDPGVEPEPLALLVLTFLRGSEALSKSGYTPARMQAAAEQFIAMLPSTASCRRFSSGGARSDLLTECSTKAHPSPLESQPEMRKLRIQADPKPFTHAGSRGREGEIPFTCG